MSNIEAIDKNFSSIEVSFVGMHNYDPRKAPFSIHGLLCAEKGGKFLRMPQTVADTINSGVAELCTHTAGGRIRFRTDSKRVALKWYVPYIQDFSHMPRTGAAFFDLYANGEHIHTFIPPKTEPPEEEVPLEAIVHIPFEGMCDILIHFPLYNEINDIAVALEKDATVLPATPYAHELPVVFYGSSITQGGCASRGGTAYPAILARNLDTEILNLGFSGSCRAELAMADYIATLPMSAFVFDYDHNASDAQFLQNTHEPFFKRLREKRPDLPVIMISAADNCFADREQRRAVIRRTYENAVANGDRRVFFLDGQTFYEAVGAENCRVDQAHPNDLGMWCMAHAMEPVLKDLL